MPYSEITAVLEVRAKHRCTFKIYFKIQHNMMESVGTGHYSGKRQVAFTLEGL